MLKCSAGAFELHFVKKFDDIGGFSISRVRKSCV